MIFNFSYLKFCLLVNEHHIFLFACNIGFAAKISAHNFIFYSFFGGALNLLCLYIGLDVMSIICNLDNSG